MITKNVNIRETWYGFAVYNNGIVAHRAKDIKEAKDKAFALAKVEHKGVRMDTDYWHERYSSKKVQTI